MSQKRDQSIPQDFTGLTKKQRKKSPSASDETIAEIDARSRYPSSCPSPGILLLCLSQTTKLRLRQTVNPPFPDLHGRLLFMDSSSATQRRPEYGAERFRSTRRAAGRRPENTGIFRRRNLPGTCQTQFCLEPVWVCRRSAAPKQATGRLPAFLRQSPPSETGRFPHNSPPQRRPRPPPGRGRSRSPCRP